MSFLGYHLQGIRLGVFAYFGTQEQTRPVVGSYFFMCTQLKNDPTVVGIPETVFSSIASNRLARQNREIANSSSSGTRRYSTRQRRDKQQPAHSSTSEPSEFVWRYGTDRQTEARREGEQGGYQRPEAGRGGARRRGARAGRIRSGGRPERAWAAWILGGGGGGERIGGRAAGGDRRGGANPRSVGLLARGGAPGGRRK